LSDLRGSLRGGLRAKSKGKRKKGEGVMKNEELKMKNELLLLSWLSSCQVGALRVGEIVAF